MLKVTHVITGLGAGGAEHALLRLLAAVDARRVSATVVSLTDHGALGPAISQHGIPVEALGLSGWRQLPSGIVRLAAMLRRQRPDIVQTWMYHADLIGGLAARLAGVRHVVWGIRASNLTADIKRRTRAAARVEAALSGLVPSKIVSCGHAARDVHVALGYRADRVVVIPNGFDLPTLDVRAGLRFRRDLAIPASAVVVGRAGRYHPQKDYPTFVSAAARVSRVAPSSHFLVCGDRMTRYNDELIQLIDDAGMAARFHLAGPLADMKPFYSAIDLACSSSAFGEGFPNVVAEAMSFAVPAVTTDVGDSAKVVGDTGLVVAPRNAVALANALVQLIALPDRQRRALGCRARARVESEFTMDVMARRYVQLYEELVGRVRD